PAAPPGGAGPAGGGRRLARPPSRRRRARGRSGSPTAATTPSAQPEAAAPANPPTRTGGRGATQVPDDAVQTGPSGGAELIHHGPVHVEDLQADLFGLLGQGVVDEGADSGILAFEATVGPPLARPLPPAPA